MLLFSDNNVVDIVEEDGNSCVSGTSHEYLDKATAGESNYKYVKNIDCIFINCIH